MNTTKTAIRLACFGAAVLLALLAVAVNNTLRMLHYKRQVESSYVRALQELSSQMNAITSDLKKSQYAGTTAQQAAISARVWRNAATAKTALGLLPAGESQAELEDAYRFLSQVGDYAMYLTGKSMIGGEITGEEADAYTVLLDYSRQLGHRADSMQQLLSTGDIGVRDITLRDPSPDTGAPEAGAPRQASVMLEAEEKLESYPALIYDGPFSDHLLQRSPAMTKDEQVVGREVAMRTAAAWAGLSPALLRQGDDEESRMPLYAYLSDDLEVGVTRQGGHVAYLVSGREIGPRRLLVEDGLLRARAFLESHGIGAMTETYYELANGVLTVNYAYQAGDVICYTDLIKVGIAMDDGEVVFYDARGYINNHRDRRLDEPYLTPDNAARSLSKNLEANQTRLALVPTAGLDEALCYEFRCKGKQDEDVLVYINTENGAEEQILILIHRENGTLAM